MTAVSTKKALATAAAIFVISSACEKNLRDLNPKDNKKNNAGILFVSNRDGNDEIYSMKLDGSNISRLTINDVPDGRATWSANGQHVAFASGAIGSRDIYIMKANGSGLRNITNTPNADEDFPEWSPIGNFVIFSSNRDGNHEIYVTNFDGNNVKRLTFRPEDDKWPTFSPDGRRISFQSNLGSPALTDVFVMNADGTGIIRLTEANAFDQMPTWSPDGKKIAFMSARDGNPEIYVMNKDGSNQIRLTNSPAVDGRPSWSWETGWIVFTSARDFDMPSTFPKFEIYKMKGDGSNPIRLTDNSIYDDFPFVK